MTDDKCALESDVIRLEADFNNLSKTVDIVTESLFGKKGIKEKLDRLLGGIEAYKYIGGGGGLAGIVAFIITVISFFKGG